MSQSTPNNASPELSYISSMLNKTIQNRNLAIVLFKKLFLELPEQIELLENKLLTQELIQAHTVAHKLHGSLSFCGFTELQALSNQLETSLLADDLQQAKQIFLQLKQEINIFQSLQNRILQHLGKQI